MTDTTLKATPERTTLASHAPEWAIAGLAWLCASLGLAFQVHPVGIFLAIAILPLLNALLWGRTPTRGAAIACVATMFCVGISASGPSQSPGTAILVIGLINAGAILGSATAERLRGAIVEEPLPVGWTIDVEIQYPVDPSTSTRRESRSQPSHAVIERPLRRHLA